MIYCLYAAPDPDFHIYLLFGQSNMAGACNGWTATNEALDYQDADCDTTSRVRLMAFTNCSNAQSNPCRSITFNRSHNEWYTAFPPYHNCNEGIGPGNYFVKTLLDSIREDIRIGIIPCALSGQSIKIFKKGQKSQVPDWCNKYLFQQGSVSVYDWMKEKCQIAQQSGVIKGILFHQGESDASNPSNWISDVKSVFDNLKNDLDLDDSIPIIVGELLYAEAGGTCASMNPRINQLAAEYPRCKVASARELTMMPKDEYNVHFGCTAQRELGYRYARAFLSLADNDWVSRIGTVKTIHQRSSRASIRKMMVQSGTSPVKAYSLDGRAIATFPANGITQALSRTHSRGVFLISRSMPGGTTAIIPFLTY